MATNNQTKIITLNQLIEIVKTEIDSKKTPSLINFTNETPVKMLKTGNPYASSILTKENTKTYLPVTDYEARVNNNMKKEGVDGKHELGDLSGKKHIGKCLLTDTKTETKFYIMVEQFDAIPSSKTIYRLDGEVIDKSIVEQWLPKKSASYGSQDQKKKVQVITPGLHNIKRITINKVNYEIMNETNETAPLSISKVAQK